MMSRLGPVSVWLGLGVLAALSGCGGSSPDRAPSVPSHLTPDPHLSFVHPASGRVLASGARFEVPRSFRPGSPMSPFTLPAAESNPDPVPITYVLERPWPPRLQFNPGYPCPLGHA